MIVGFIVEHILNKEWLLILEVREESFICRTKDLRVIEVYKHEVTEKR